MNSQAELDVMRSIILVAGFRGSEFDSVCAFLLMWALRKDTITAAEIPRDLLKGDIHLSGLATKACIKMGLLEKCGYVPSPNPDAKGRPVCQLRIPIGKRPTVQTWLSRHGYASPSSISQLSLAV